ncbi:hypothetical protein SAMN05421827_12830 [Pedobacter terrae]|jgi:hypothetical protein|uniref:Uncharacterized protein n=1 Tax=Pedobacter terrae TaxID=405671 RepID=A0A1G8D745_9SPHI|nr:hypothetical protein [Pedobacter terrae]SDH53481.1 hypothetical protein SAMN05421827_12830 [Pedobacter terrae]
MKENELQNHALYKKAKRSYYFERWKWVAWNAFICLALFYKLRQHYDTFEMILFFLTLLVTVFLLAVMPKTKFENSRECQEIKEMLR